VKTNIPGTSDAVITMTASPDWVINTTGVGMIRILRLGDDGTSQVLTAGFTGYDMDTGYLTFQARSPDGLCTFALVSVKPGSGISAGIPGPGATAAGNGQNTTAPQFLGSPVPAIVFVALAMAICGGAALFAIRRKAGCSQDDAEETYDDGWEPDEDS